MLNRTAATFARNVAQCGDALELLHSLLRQEIENYLRDEIANLERQIAAEQELPDA
jgi:hypothetical protein